MMTSQPSTSFIYASLATTPAPLNVIPNRTTELPSPKDYNHLHGDVKSPLCECWNKLESACFKHREAAPVSMLNYNSDVGRIMYSLAIILMFSMIILLLMVRSIRRSNSTIEVEALLDAMRFREELDLQQRQKRRLQKAKSKVTAWLTKNNGKLWNSSPQIIIPNTVVAPPPVNHVPRAHPPSIHRQRNVRNDSMQSSGSFLPEIVISNSDDIFHRQNSATPSLSLLYDFDVRSRKNSAFTEMSETFDLSQFSDPSFSNELEPQTPSPQPLLGSQLSLNVNGLGQTSI